MIKWEFIDVIVYNFMEYNTDKVLKKIVDAFFGVMIVTVSKI